MNGNEVAKVMGRVTIDISPAQAQLNQLAADYDAANKKMMDSTVKSQGTIAMSEKDAAAQRLMSFMALSAQIEMAQKESDARMERENQRSAQKILQDQEYARARLQKMMMTPASVSSGGAKSSGFAPFSALELGTMMAEFSGLAMLAQSLNVGLVDISKSAAGLQQVFADDTNTQQKLTDVTNQFIDVAKEYGTSVQDVVDAGKLWGRQYKDVNTALALTRNSTMLSIVDNMNVADSNRAVEGSLAAMAIQMNNVNDANVKSMKLIDSWTAVSHGMSVSAKDLADGFERSAGAAHQAGLNIDQLSALIAVGVRNSGLDGANIGNAWSHILTNIATASPKVQQAFQHLGITMTEMGANGQQVLKPTWELVMELSQAAQHASVSDAQWFKVISGGTFQVSKLEDALRDTTMINKAYDTSMQSSGETQKLVQAQMNTFAADLQRLKDSLEQVAYNLGQSGIGNVLKDMIVGVTDLINGIQKLPPAVDYVGFGLIALMTTGKAMSGVLNILKGSFEMMLPVTTFWRNVIVSANSPLEFLGNTMKNFRTYIVEKTTAMAADTAVTRGAGVASAAETVALETQTVAETEATAGMSALATATAIATAGISVIVAAIAVWAMNLGSANSETQQTTQSVQDFTAALQQQNQQMQSNQSQTVQNVNALEGLKEKYIEVQQTLATAKKGSQEYNQAEQTVLEIENQLISIVGQRAATQILSSKDVVAAINAERKAMIENEITTEQEFIAKQQASASATQKVISDTENRITALMTEINALQAAAQAEEALSKQYAVGSLAYEEHLSNQMLDNQKVDSVKSTLSDLDKQISQQEGKWNSVQQAISGANDRITQLKNNLKELSVNPNGILNDVAAPSGATLGSGGSSSGSKSKSGGGSSSALSQYVQPFKDLTQSDDAALKPFQARIDAIANSLQSFKDSMSAARSALQQNMSDTKSAADYATAYGNTVKETTAHENALASQNWESSQLMKQLSRDIANVNAQYKAGRITAQEHKDALSTLSQEYDRLTNSIKSNDSAINQDKKDMASATQDMRNEITSMLKSAYDEEKTVQEDALQNIYQPQIDALTQQKDAVDALIQSLQQQWQTQSQVNQLTDLQNQLAAVKSDTSFRVVNTDGSVSWTYDQSKAADLQKQITDQQTKIAHDAEIQQLQDQKNSLDQQIKDLQNAYNDKKKALDDYWAYRTSQDQLNSEADRLILKDGYTKSLQDAQTFVQQMNTIYSQLQMPGSTAGGAVSAGLSQVNAGTAQLSPYWQGVANKGYETVAGMTPSQIAAKYGVDPNSLTKLSNGEYSIPWSQLQNYAFQQSGISTPTFSAPTPSFSSFSNVASSSSNTTNITKNVTIPIANVNVNNQSDIDSLIDAIHSAV